MLTIETTKPRMHLALLIEFFQTFWKSTFAIIGAWFAAFGLEPIFLAINADWELLIKAVPAIMTVLMAIVGWKWSHLKKVEEAKMMEIDRRHKIEDQYRENVNWLKTIGLINEKSTKKDIDELLETHFPKHKD